MANERTSFLLEYYRLLTDDIRRSEAIIPKVCALEAAFVGLLAVAVLEHWPTALPSLLVLLTSTWAIHQMINANLWARRSHLMAANVELEFFTSEDMDTLLPCSYYVDARVYRYRRVFRAPIALSAGFFLIGIALFPLGRNLSSVGIIVLAIVLLGSLYSANRKCGQDYAFLVAHAPGRGANDMK